MELGRFRGRLQELEGANEISSSKALRSSSARHIPLNESSRKMEFSAGFEGFFIRISSSFNDDICS
jgi:hypothetical protein